MVTARQRVYKKQDGLAELQTPETKSRMDSRPGKMQKDGWGKSG